MSYGCVVAMANDDDQLFRELEHTGDVGIALSAPTRVELFRRAAVAMAALLVEKDAIASTEQRDLTIAADTDADLMHDLLTALLCLFIVDGFIWCDASVTETGQSLHVTVKGESFDVARHSLRREIKAVTYHQLAVNSSPEGWSARVILDV
jgi:SHS2 domain-containing protein